MSNSRYKVDPRAHWAIGELLRMIEADFKRPEIEAEYQKWEEERNRDTQRDQDEQEIL